MIKWESQEIPENFSEMFAGEIPESFYRTFLRKFLRNSQNLVNNFTIFLVKRIKDLVWRNSWKFLRDFSQENSENFSRISYLLSCVGGRYKIYLTLFTYHLCHFVRQGNLFISKHLWKMVEAHMPLPEWADDPAKCFSNLSVFLYTLSYL